MAGLPQHVWLCISFDLIRDFANTKFERCISYYYIPSMAEVESYRTKVKNGIPYVELAKHIDDCLKENYHYNYARQLKQLATVRIFLANHNPTEDIVNHLESTGTKKGDIKVLSLSKITTWNQFIEGTLLKLPQVPRDKS